MERVFAQAQVIVDNNCRVMNMNNLLMIFRKIIEFLVVIYMLILIYMLFYMKDTLHAYLELFMLPIFLFLVFKNMINPSESFRKKVMFVGMVFLFLIYALDSHHAYLDRFMVPTFTLLVLFLCWCTDASTKSEKIMLALLVYSMCAVAKGLNLISDHPCMDCAFSAPDIVSKFFIPKPGEIFDINNRVHAIFHMLMDDNPLSKCAVCLSVFTNNAALVAETMPFIARQFDDRGFATLGGAGEEGDEDTCLGELDESISPRELDAWYEKIKEKSYPKGAHKRFIQAVATGLNNEEGIELLANVSKDTLCYPASRISGPNPSEFLISLQHPRFTGESNDNRPMNISFAKLTAIMRGDVMSQLGPHVCFLVRLAGLIPEDTSVLTKTISPANIAPIATETDLKGVDGAFLYPGLFVAKTDEDKDADGTGGDLSEALLTLYTRLPMVDWDPVFLDTKEEYIAFFRWNIEHKLQDEFYLPKWLSHAKAGNHTDHVEKLFTLLNETGDLASQQFRFHNERLRLIDPTSDETLSDRAFFGSGMKRMTRVKLPGDIDYEFLHPVGPDYYETEDHLEFFKLKPKPTVEDFVRMGKFFWGEDLPLSSFRDRVVEVDHTVVHHWKHRDLFDDQGAILYLDAESRRPMGIWVAAQGQLFLPNKCRLWDYAKFHYRATELTVMALRHVAEYHLGWANIVSNAIRQTLPPKHGLRVFIKPYTHGTGTVNWNAYQMLIRDNSILDRAAGLTRVARGSTWGHIQKHVNMSKTLPVVLGEKNLTGMFNLTNIIPMYTQGLRLWRVHLNFVKGFLSILYPDEAALAADTEAYRFWNHVNTYGRRMDPCVCGMDNKIFFDNSRWPGFEKVPNRKCDYLMDHAEFDKIEDPAARRTKWCRQHHIERTRALHKLLVAECKASEDCEELSYNFLHMRANMGLPPLTRKSLTNFITMFIFEVTAGHQLAADNIPYMVDPSYGGVRLQRKDEHGKLPLMVDLATYIFGTVISALTTIRSKPLLSDWSHLLDDWAEKQGGHNVSETDRAALKHQLADLHLKYKTELVILSNDFLIETLQKPENQGSPFLIPAAQATSIAV